MKMADILDKFSFCDMFSFNEETKKYLLKYNSDFDLVGLEDLALYKDNKIKFSSCTHEKFNSEE